MARPRFELPIHFLGAAAFALQGVYISSFGPMYPELLEHFDLPQSQVGLIASANFLGSSSAVLSTTWLMGRLGVRRILMIAPVLLAGGALGIGLAPSWSLALLFALIAGLGAGGITSGINMALANLPGRSAAVLNAVNAMFGLGSVLGPLLVASTPTAGIRWPFVVVGILALLLFALSRHLPKVLPDEAKKEDEGGSKRGVTLFALLFCLYVMTEVGAGSWMTTHLAPQLGVERAAAMVSAFWVAFMAGRFLGSPLALKFPPQVLVIGAAVLAIVSSALANVPEARVPAYILLGLVLGPIFPTTVAWYGKRLTSRLLPMAMTGGSVGAMVVQPLMGSATSRFGVQAIPVTLAVLACCMLALAVWVRVFPGTATKASDSLPTD